MKRIVILSALILLAWTVCLVGCTYVDPGDNDPGDDLPDGWVSESYPPQSDTGTDEPPVTDTEDCSKVDPVPDVVEVVDIVDLTKNGDIVTADALEGFYSDGEYNYYFPSIKSQYVTVHYSDGTTQPVTEALAEGRVTIEDLDRFDIGYYKEILDCEVYVIHIIDRTVAEGIPTDTALEKFWEDAYAEYYFPTIRSEYVIAIYSNDEIHPIVEALENGLVTIDQLDLYNIDYIAVEKPPVPLDIEVVNITNRAEEHGIGTADQEEVFYEDDEYRYIFPSLISDYIIVEYDAGWQENVKTALKYGRASVDDLDKFGIKYYKEPKAELSNPNIKDIYDRVARGEIGIDNGEGMYDDVYDDPFYEDDEFIYILSDTPYEGAFIVVYHDGTREIMIHALAAGHITISDLDAFGIKYYKEPK